MCGFCGLLPEKGPVDVALLTKMRDRMLHRGPDEGANYLGQGFGLGFRRLSIIDLATGRQPLSNEDKSIHLACNGEIYNFAALRRELTGRGHRFFTGNDAEVIIHLYEEKGTGCLEFLRGMFSFVLWDEKKQLLFGARDRFGIKPFYYLDQNGVFACASEIKALAALPTFPRQVNEGAFVDYLTFQYVPEPRTLFQGVYRLPPGHYLLKTAGKPPQLNRYWRINFSPCEKPLAYFVEGLRHKLREAVKLHLQSDVPRGAFLSSGIDSAIITALVREQEPISTFSVGYREAGYSELPEARQTAEYLETDHHEYIISPAEFLDHLPRLIWHLDEPVADPAAISLYFVARQARQKITVTLSGEGADEVFAGYAIYREPFALAPLKQLPNPLRRSLDLLEGLLPSGIPGKNYLARARQPLEERFIGNASIFSPGEKKGITPVQEQLSPYRLTAPLYRQVAHLDEVTRMQYIDLNTWMPGDILVKADKMTMANSLELRVPFLDHHVFEFAATIPPNCKIQGKTTKKLLREAFKDILPQEAINRPKRGFPVPTREWLKRNDFHAFFRQLLQEEGNGWFNKKAVEQLYSAHTAGKHDYSRRLWTILIFLLWHRTFISNKRAG
ncbi:MAG: asparagine synthase (glutamine-hydrolyzing) [Bacillota bacterium]